MTSSRYSGAVGKNPVPKDIYKNGRSEVRRYGVKKTETYK